MPTDQGERAGIAGVVEAHIGASHEGHIAETGLNGRAHHRTEPGFVEHLLTGDHPCHIAVRSRSRCREVGHRSGLGMQPTEAPLPRRVVHQAGHLGGHGNRVVAYMHLAVIGGDHQRRPRGQLRHRIGHQLVGCSQFGVVVRAETPLVRDLVDTVVVGVHEPFATAQQFAHRDRQARCGPPPHRPATAQMGLGER